MTRHYPSLIPLLLTAFLFTYRAGIAGDFHPPASVIASNDDPPLSADVTK